MLVAGTWIGTLFVRAVVHSGSAKGLVVIAGVGCLLTAPATGSPPTTSNLLVALPSLGTVTWRCTADEGRYRLGFRVFGNGATTDVRLVVGGRTVSHARVDPGEAPALIAAGLSQRLLLTQFTGAGTLRAVVEVEFLRHPVASPLLPLLTSPPPGRGDPRR